MPRTAVVSLLGGLTHLAPLDPAGVATDLAGRINAECYVLPVPVFADEPEHRDLFMGQNSIQEAMRWARRASVGQEDHLSKLVEARGFLEFWRLNMRPGKPVGLGDIDDCPILVLPGNPMAAAVAFKFLGEVLIGCLSGDTVNYPKTMTLQLSAPYQTKFDRLEIFAARLINSPEGSVSIEILLHQGSANLVALATGEGLVVLEPNIFLPGKICAARCYVVWLNCSRGLL